MARTKRIIIDQGFFDQNGIAWTGREEFSYTQEELATVALDDHIIVQVPFAVYLGGTTPVAQLTVWGRGLISIGPPTLAQEAFMRSWSPGSSIFGFPGDFIAVNLTGGVVSAIEVGRGYVDRSDEPNSSSGQFGYNEFSARDRFTIRIGSETIEFDESGFTAFYAYFNSLPAYRLGGVEYTYTVSNLPPSQLTNLTDSARERDFIYVNDFANSPSTISGDLVTGTPANDVLTPIGDPTTSDAQTIAGLGGNDLITGGVGNDVLIGGQGDDEINGDPAGAFGGDDNIHGGDGADFLKGGFGSDFLFGDGGNDVLHGGPGQDLLRGGDGNDYMLGEDGADVLDGGAGADTMRGEGGGDIYYVDNVGDDVFEGFTSGIDTVYSSLAVYTMPNGIEQLYSSGSAIDVRFTGNMSANVIRGSSGDDVLSGGSGADTLRGDSGIDTFRDTAAGLNLDTISDFTAIDRIVISDATLAGFTFSLSGSTLTFTGGALTLTGGITGRLVASAAPEGGVQLTINNVRNDFDGDGRSDILWRNVNGQMSNWLGQANGGFVQNNANAAAVVPTSWQIAGTGDFNGDGRDDILWRNTDGQLSNWLATAAGGFTQNNANAAAVVPTSWQVVGTGDFNGDGRDDILWRNTDGTVSNWLGTASGGFTPNDANAARFVPTSWTVVGTGDFNGDGRDDILWRNSNGQVSDWLGQANGGFILNDANALTNVDTAWKVVGTGDFNGDGRDDILWRNDNGQLSNWLGQANGGFVNNGAVSGAFVPLAWSVVAIGDYNGDGRDDILWRNADGTVTDWLGNANGSFTPNDANAASVVPTAWHVQPEAPFI